MPTYEYKCFACNHTFERFQSITSDPIKRCPECGKAKVKRLLGTGAGFVFKGSGFYITDYRSEGYKEKAKAESGAASGGSSDAKPAAGGDSGGNKTEGTSSAGSSDSSTKSPAPAAPAKTEPTPKAPDKGRGKKG